MNSRRVFKPKTPPGFLDVVQRLKSALKSAFTSVKKPAALLDQGKGYTDFADEPSERIPGPMKAGGLYKTSPGFLDVAEVLIICLIICLLICG